MAPRLRLLLLLLLPAGCAAPEDRELAALRLAAESSQASLAATAPAPVPALPPRPAPRAASLIDIRHAPPGPRPVAAAELLGAGPETLRRWLGEPSLRRSEGGAEIWLYAGEGCALDLVLYPAGGGLRVAHAAARAHGTEPRTEVACLRGIAAPPAMRPIPAAAGPMAEPDDRGI
ncbi:hypothetical protein [Roseicella aerolata]|uniref:Lipoprotein n=1 Tax=Roseicella aerolata TaxID=2883479 RepID=A0A9X1ID82_9PROT|nr:hypothetical protein [Roseicella aerolata]MCB4822720.1 hypothetical protein [Roseicella aerolata]